MHIKTVAFQFLIRPHNVAVDTYQRLDGSRPLDLRSRSLSLSDFAKIQKQCLRDVHHFCNADHGVSLRADIPHRYVALLVPSRGHRTDAVPAECPTLLGDCGGTGTDESGNLMPRNSHACHLDYRAPLEQILKYESRQPAQCKIAFNSAARLAQRPSATSGVLDRLRTNT